MDSLLRKAISSRAKLNSGAIETATYVSMFDLRWRSHDGMKFYHESVRCHTENSILQYRYAEYAAYGPSPCLQIFVNQKLVVVNNMYCLWWDVFKRCRSHFHVPKWQLKKKSNVVCA